MTDMLTCLTNGVVECVVPLSTTTGELQDVIQRELRSLSPRGLTSEGNRLHVVGGLLRPVLGLNLLVPASRVVVSCDVTAGQARMSYVANFVEIIVACLVIGAAVAFAAAKAGGPWFGGVALGVVMATCNVLLFRLRFRRFLVRCAKHVVPKS
jgi:hypothetical protein